MTRVALVTGSNKGIGYAIVRGLCRQFDGVVYLTARNPDLGLQAVEKLKGELETKQGDKLRFHQLDINDQKSIAALKEHLVSDYGGLNVLVNNAGIAFTGDSTVEFGEQARVTLATNYTATKAVCDSLFPLLREHARVVNVCSRMGQLTRGYSEEMRAKLTREDLTVKELDEIVDRFVRLAGEGNHVQNGYPNSAYGMSKAAEIALSCIQHRQLSKDKRQDIVINWCCPGTVSTDMSGHRGKSIDQGADTMLYLALLPNNADGPKGKFVGERKEIDWANGKFDFFKDS